MTNAVPREPDVRVADEQRDRPAPSPRRPAVVGPPDGRPWLRFTVAATAAGSAFWALYAAFVLTEPGQRAENLALLGAALRSATDREESLDQLSQISLVTFAVAIAAVFLIAAVRRRPGLGLLAAVVMGVSVSAAELFKEVLPRPELVTGPAWILRNSFPSGTATVAASIGVALLLVSPDRLRWLTLPAGAVFAAVIGQATQIVGWHRMSGAIGGVLLAVATACAALVVLAMMGLVSGTDQGRINARIRGILIVAGAGAIVLGTVVLAISVAFPLLTAPTGASGVFLHTTFDLVGLGATVLIFVALSVAIEPFTLGRSRAGDAPPPDRSAST